MRFHFRVLVYLFVVMCVSAANAGPREDYFLAIANDAVGTVSAFLEKGTNPNIADDDGQVGLFLALRSESPAVVAALLAHPKIDVDRANRTDETPVMMAALRGNLEVTRQLLDRGARLNRDGWTPLHYAASGPDPRVISLLLERGAQIDALSPNGTTPLMMAARYGSEASAELLLQHGANRTLRNQRNLSAADFARQAGRDALAVRLEPR